MDNRMLEYYNRELAWLREMGTEFARQYPKVAGRLGMSGDEAADPYVERLLEGFAFLTSRIQMKMDAQFPHFSGQLLNMLYPNYLAGIPSMAIVELQPDAGKGDISQGFVVPRGTVMDARALKYKGITCRYRTAHDVTLQPLQIRDVTLGGLPAGLSPAADGAGEALSALRIRLSCFDNVCLEQMQCNHLMFYLSAGDVQAQQLLELIMQHTLGVLCQTGGFSPQNLRLDAGALHHEGFDINQALLPPDERNLDGYRLVQEYFYFPPRFRFFSIHGLQPLLARGGKQRQLDIILLLDKAEPELECRVNADHLALHCTPVINLFPRTAERIVLNERQPDYHLVVDRLRPRDYEIYSVLKLHGSGHQGDNGYQRLFKPIYSVQRDDCPHDAGYFSLRREQIPWPAGDGYSGSEVFIALADEAHPPWHNDLKFLSAEVLCSNRQLPLQYGPADADGFVLQDSVPIQRIRLRNGPSAPRPAQAQNNACWQLINQLQLNYFSLMDGDESGGALRRLLNTHAEQAGAGQHIAGIRGCRLEPCHRLMAPPAMYARGISIQLMVDEQAFSGASSWLLGSVLSRLFARLATINSFTETRLISVQRGAIGFWPAQAGGRTPL
ncbi:type VI secretion system baseplate subunit TssF [Sodalis ligni]|uniref:type VI secretion system baseplate subunit TssF n=1 Tax=Sodalis ligni TaxID=2697027 RepID=UPI00193F29B1|nr:type VI secretion system baseplate subunit TssF [Sodalis ligni]QWA11548.1 type VI secretion system baseplate subunit TssF [Sodalis ligni]